jgi:hypothetical protein
MHMTREGDLRSEPKRQFSLAALLKLEDVEVKPLEFGAVGEHDFVGTMLCLGVLVDDGAESRRRDRRASKTWSMHWPFCPDTVGDPVAAEMGIGDVIFQVTHSASKSQVRGLVYQAEYCRAVLLSNNLRMTRCE